MNKNTKRIIIGILTAGAGYAAWRFLIKPRVVEKRVKNLIAYQDKFDEVINQIPTVNDTENQA